MRGREEKNEGHVSEGAGTLFVLVVAALVGAGVRSAQGQTREHNQPEIFCLAKSAGQLCNHGSAEVLKLDGAKKERWTEAANRYNKAVDAATKQLLEDAKATLSAEEFATVQKWFDKSLNAQLNRQLLASPTTHK